MSWTLLPTFLDSLPYEFQLQVGTTKNPQADDWEDVGAAVTNTFCSVDGEQRIYGKSNWSHYRVHLTTSAGVYVSEPTGIMGTLSRRDWRIAREILRQELVRMRLVGQEGYLLKRRVTGEPCTECLDPLTGEVTQPRCPTCRGTGFRCGYYFPVDCIWADIDPKTYHTEIKGARGTTRDIVVRARMVNTWMLDEEDIWVNRTTDDRLYVHRVQNVAEHRGVPLIANVELRPAPVTDVAYDMEIPDQEEALVC